MPLIQQMTTYGSTFCAFYYNQKPSHECEGSLSAVEFNHIEPEGHLDKVRYHIQTNILLLKYVSLTSQRTSS